MTGERLGGAGSGAAGTWARAMQTETRARQAVHRREGVTLAARPARALPNAPVGFVRTDEQSKHVFEGKTCGIDWLVLRFTQDDGVEEIGDRVIKTPLFTASRLEAFAILR
jgi:hypothetical protein